MSDPVPAFIDHLTILAELNAWGWRDFKIETVCGFGAGYVSQLKCKDVTNMAYHRAARLYNFWLSERDKVSQGTSRNQVASVTS